MYADGLVLCGELRTMRGRFVEICWLRSRRDQGEFLWIEWDLRLSQNLNTLFVMDELDAVEVVCYRKVSLGRKLCMFLGP